MPKIKHWQRKRRRSVSAGHGEQRAAAPFKGGRTGWLQQGWDVAHRAASGKKKACGKRKKKVKIAKTEDSWHRLLSQPFIARQAGCQCRRHNAGPPGKDSPALCVPLGHHCLHHCSAGDTWERRWAAAMLGLGGHRGPGVVVPAAAVAPTMAPGSCPSPSRARAKWMQLQVMASYSTAWSMATRIRCCRAAASSPPFLRSTLAGPRVRRRWLLLCLATIPDGNVPEVPVGQT